CRVDHRLVFGSGDAFLLSPWRCFQWGLAPSSKRPARRPARRDCRHRSQLPRARLLA
ncbi:unnamed protein product, partial [Symbiodinium necroappetens]